MPRLASVFSTLAREGKPMNAWLWPDRRIGKRESRRLREEHNALYNINAELVETFEEIRQLVKSNNPDKLDEIDNHALWAIRRNNGMH